MYRYMDRDGVWVVEGHDDGSAWWVGPNGTRVRTLEAAARFTSERTARSFAIVMNAEAFQILE